MFGCRRFTTSRREVQTMASHLTAGSISRAQQRTLPTAHSNVCSPVDEFAQSVASNINASVASSVTVPPGCGMLAAAQPAGSTFHSLLREEQQPGAPRDVSSQQAAAGARVALSSPACSSGDAAAERACSWYGQRVWARAASAQLASGVSQTAAAAAPQGPGCAPAGVDVSGTVNASPQQLQAWKFSVMCYNILADTYAQYFAPKLYRDVPRPYLDWNHRLRLLVEEIRHWAPDVVCLQEVQHYDELEPEMRAAGYEGRFMRRTGRRRDGCATFWRSDRLRACSIQRLDFAPLGLEDNVAMLLSLAPRCEEAAAAGMDSQSAESLSSVRLLVATTHITFDPAKGDVKLGQVRTLLSRAADLAAKPPPEEPEQELLHGHSHHPHGRQHQHHNQHPHFHYHNQHYHSHLNLHEQRHHHQNQQHSNHHHDQNQNHSQQHNHQHGQDGEARLPQQQQQQQHRHHHQNQIQGQSQDSAAAAVEGRWRRPSVAPRAGGSMVDLMHGGQQQQPQPHPNQQLQQEQQRRAPLQTLAIITGDFNSTAGSPLYQFVARGSLDLARTNRKKLSGQLHGVCHTQYKPVSEVKQLHAQCTAAAAAAAVAATTAAGSDTTAGGGETSADTPMVTAAPASPPGTPPSTPFVTAAAPASASTETKPAGSGSGTATPASVVQRLASAAMDSASTAISVCTAKAAAAASCPNLASPAARAAAAVKVLDAFLSSPAAGAHRGGAERWSEKELRCAMGDQYDAAVVQLMDGGVGSVADAAGRAMLTSASMPTFFSGAGPVARCGGAAAAGNSSSQLSSQQQAKMGRQQNPPAVNRLSLNGASGPGGAGAGSGRRSLDLGRSSGAGAAAAAAAQGSESGGPLVVRHPLQLKSSYVEVARAEPAFTSIHSGFMGTVDFIWYTADAILQQQHPQQGPVAGEQAEAAPAPMPPASASAAAAGRAAAEAPASSATMAAAAAAVPCDCRGAVEDGSQQLQSGSPQEEGTCGSAADSAASAAAGDCAAASEKEAEEEVGRRFQLVPVAVLQPPDLELLPQGLPAAGWGSDHVCVVTHFELRPVA